MFYDNPNIEKIAPKIFVYRNFVPKEMVDAVNKEMAQYSLEDFILDDHAIDWYADKTGPNVLALYPVWDLISDLLEPEFCVHPNLSMQVMKPGDTMFVHSDSPGRDMEEDLTQQDRWNTCCIIEYGVCVYFGEFTGGEVFYPVIGLEVSVNPGDLVIHGTLAEYEHGVREVKSGLRYCYSNFSLYTNENPGTFPVRGSEEELSRRSTPMTWMTPLGDINPITGVALTSEKYKSLYGEDAPKRVDTNWKKETSN